MRETPETLKARVPGDDHPMSRHRMKAQRHLRIPIDEALQCGRSAPARFAGR
jgi:hypothetical protein